MISDFSSVDKQFIKAQSAKMDLRPFHIFIYLKFPAQQRRRYFVVSGDPLALPVLFILKSHRKRCRIAVDACVLLAKLLDSLTI